MTLHEFIYSRKKPQRYYRHIAFWAAHFIFWSLWAGVFFRGIKFWVSWLIQEQGFFGLHIYYHIFYTYLIVYYLWPKYFETKRYWIFGISVVMLSLSTFILYIAHMFWLKDLNGLPRNYQLIHIYFFFMKFIFTGPPVICAIFLTVKMLKNYYLKMQEKATVIKESANAELQLLKAQIHPHFLFNTLNNIYSFNLNRSPLAADLVLKLSQTLKYMVNDCEAALVPLDKELKMLQDYIGLEKVRYGKRLKLTTEITGDVKDKLIAPLLMIPFVENSFKHGASKMLEHPWIIIQISVKRSFLDLMISNSKPVNPAPPNGNNGIGLKNVRKRLDLLYPEEYQLEIKSDEHTFHVELKVPLTLTNYSVARETNPPKALLPGTYATY